MTNAWAGVLLEAANVGVTLGGVRVIDGVDLTAEPRSWTAVVGPNGAGKSTLLRALAGLTRHDGRVLLDGRDVQRLGPRVRAAEVGYAPQSPLLPEWLTVREYVLLGRTPYRSLLTGPRAQDQAVVTAALDRLDITQLAGRRLRTLSGGERQRAVLARVLAQQPRLLLLDEPTSSLDLGHAQDLLELIDQLRHEEGLTVVSTLHDLALAAQYAERIVLLSAGRVAAVGSPEGVLTAEALAAHYGACAEVSCGPDGVRVHPVRPRVAGQLLK
jgi:iron complex transport system ATP-binding protein